jgi:REP element-mobilizing transposase RayT
LAVQKLKDDPDAVLINIRYHLAWNVIHRRSSFSDPEKAFKIIDEALFECGLSVSSFVSLLWLAPDHLHIYVESDGEKSVETITQEIKGLSEPLILAEGSAKIPKMSTSNDLWDRAYFAETIG